MAALSFPENPSDGDLYQGYIYDATAGVWNSNPAQIASRFVTSANPPASPSEGDGWFDSTTGNSYSYYDGTWVQLGAFGAISFSQLEGLNLTTPANGESLVFDGTNWVNQNVSVDVYGVDSNATDRFSLPVGSNAERPATPKNGDIRFNTDSNQPEWYSELESRWVNFSSKLTISFEYLVIGGGGGATGGRSGINYGSGGAAGVARVGTRLISETFSIAIGAGGAAVSGGAGGTSVFEQVSATGGYSVGTGFTGGSNEDYSAINYQSGTQAGGGVGASGSNSSGNGGPGYTSSITGSPVVRGGGGAGGNNGSPGSGGGGVFNSGNGETNTGSGGGGGSAGAGGAGGSGVVILRYPSATTLDIGPGLSSSTVVSGDYKVTTFTAGTDLVAIA